MAFKKYKLQIFISGLLILYSISVSAQYLGRNSLSAEANAGFLQQKLKLGYQYNLARYEGVFFKNRMNQLFAGVSFGSTNLRYSLIEPWKRYHEFQMFARGTHIGGVVSNVIIKTKKGRKGIYKYSAFSVKYDINNFKRVHSFYKNYDKYNKYTDTENVVNAKCNTNDIEFMFAKFIRINPNNFVKAGLYFGLRQGSTTGIINKKNNNTENVTESLNFPIIGISFGYQLHLGM